MTKITTHVADAKNRLLQQYRGKPGIESIITALGNQIQIIEDVLDDLLNKRSIDDGEGVQLDGIGTIIKLPRPTGMSDVDYRIRLKAQILTLISNGEPETLIQIFSLLTGATKIDYREIFPAGHKIASSTELPADLVDAVWQALETAAVGGTKFVSVGKFDNDNPFVFDGFLLFGGGFGDIGNATKGGKLAKLYPIGPEFKFVDSDENTAHIGLGDLNDSATGARFGSL